MVTFDMVVYLLVFAVSLIFSLSVLNIPEFFSVETVIYSIFAWICWFSLAGFHIILAYDSAFLTVAYLWLGLGLMFFVLTFVGAIGAVFNVRKSKKWSIGAMAE